MTEEQARDAVIAQVGMAATLRLEMLAGLVAEENQQQNLVAPATLPVMWQRHLLDSIQLIQFAPAAWSNWIDIGTGGGFPGLAIAAVTGSPVTLVEPRKRRAAFLTDAAARLGLAHVRVVTCKIEQIADRADVITARAVASIGKLLLAARQCATNKTIWILPRGRLVEDELSLIRTDWEGMFHVERSVTDPTSVIVVASGVAPR